MFNQEDLKNLLLTIDPNLKKGFWNGSAESYTCWAPHTYSSSQSDDHREDRMIMVTIDRWSKNPNDMLATEIEAALDENYINHDDPILVLDEESGYWRWIIDCQVMA